MIFKADWEKTQSQYHIADQTILKMLGLAYPNHQLIAYHVIEGGCANLNVQIQIKEEERPLILRIYLRDKEAALREQKLGQLLHPNIPVPQTYYLGELENYRFAIINSLPGISLREYLLQTPCPDIRNIMHQSGLMLARIASYTFPKSGFLDHNLSVVKEINPADYMNFAHDCFHNSTVQAILVTPLISRIKAHFEKYTSLFPQGMRSLVHADFDPSNIFVERIGKYWFISGVLDWEYAFSGSVLWDVASMLRYAHKMPPEFRHAFLGGLQEGGIILPQNWQIILHILTILALLDCLTHVSIEKHPQRIHDIQELINYSLQQLDIIEPI